MYSLETGYKYKFVQNEKARVIVNCIHKEEKSRKWRIHASQKLRIDGFFMISKMDLNHTCGAPCKDKRKCYTSNLVESVIL